MYKIEHNVKHHDGYEYTILTTWGMPALVEGMMELFEAGYEPANTKRNDYTMGNSARGWVCFKKKGEVLEKVEETEVESVETEEPIKKESITVDGADKTLVERQPEPDWEELSSRKNTADNRKEIDAMADTMYGIKLDRRKQKTVVALVGRFKEIYEELKQETSDE